MFSYLFSQPWRIYSSHITSIIILLGESWTAPIHFIYKKERIDLLVVILKGMWFRVFHERSVIRYPRFHSFFEETPLRISLCVCHWDHHYTTRIDCVLWLNWDGRRLYFLEWITQLSSSPICEMYSSEHFPSCYSSFAFYSSRYSLLSQQ